jgi:predicted GNAT family acetyltransferase
MTPEEVEALVHKKTRKPVTVRTLNEPFGDEMAYLSYSIDDRNQFTIWHTEVPSQMQHLGVGGLLVERALKVMKEGGASLRLVCPFAKDYLARHPELREQNAAAKEAFVERESLESGETF